MNVVVLYLSSPLKDPLTDKEVIKRQVNVRWELLSDNVYLLPSFDQ